MDVNISDKSQWEKIVEVSLPTKELEADFEKAYHEYKKKIRLEGFRQGKVPISLIKNIFGKEIEAKVAEEKIPDLLEKINEDNKYKLISPAKIEEFSYTKAEGLKFKAALEIVPDIELQTYEGLMLEKIKYEVGEDDVNLALEDLLERHALMTNIDGEAKVGHFIIADLQKLDISGVPIIGEKYENRYFQLTENGRNNEWTHQLVGVKVGDTRRVRLTVQAPEEKVDDFSVTVKEIKEKTLPELDDEFAKDMGDFETLNVLKDKLKEDLEDRAYQDYEQRFTEHVKDEIVKANQFDIPEPMVKNYLNHLIDKLKKDDKNRKIDEAEIRENYRGDAIRFIKWALIRNKLSELKSIKIEESEIDEHIEKISKNNEKDRVTIENYYRNKDNREKLSDDLLQKKVVQFIIDHATVTEKTICFDDLKQESKIIT